MLCRKQELGFKAVILKHSCQMWPICWFHSVIRFRSKTAKSMTLATVFVQKKNNNNYKMYIFIFSIICLYEKQ